MKIDFKQLAKLEKLYAESENILALNTLQAMLDSVLNNNRFIDSSGLEHTSVNQIAVNTLKDLKILKEDKEKEVQQLNS